MELPIPMSLRDAYKVCVFVTNDDVHTTPQTCPSSVNGYDNETISCHNLSQLVTTSTLSDLYYPIFIRLSMSAFSLGSGLFSNQTSSSCNGCFTNSDRVELNQFSVRILGSDIGFKNSAELIKKDTGFYYRVKHNTNYKIELKNNRSVRCDVKVSIDGSIIGDFRLEAYGSMTIERPADQARKFLFLKANSKAAASAGIQSGDFQNGVIKVKFTPEKAQLVMYKSLGAFGAPVGAANMQLFAQNEMYSAPAGALPRMRSIRRPNAIDAMFESASDSLSFDSAGATALGGASSQTFTEVPDLTEIDSANITEIAVRLVAASELKPVAIGLRNQQPAFSIMVPPPLKY